MLAGIALCVLAAIASAADDTATDQLLARLDRISHMQGDFEQRQFDESDAVLATSSGVFSLLRPFYFSWEIRFPDNQLIIANAEYLWHYDIDLQTATRRPVVGNIEASPLQVLGGDESTLREQYVIEQVDANTFTLIPRGTEHSFRRLAVSFADNAISGMDIIDRLGQRVVVEFSQVDTSTPLNAADFEFTPPPGDVDLFYYDE